MELAGGLLVDDSAVTLAMQLEARGHRLSSDRGVLKVSNGAQLKPEDIATIRRLRHHLIAIAGYSGLRTHDMIPEWQESDTSARSAESHSFATNVRCEPAPSLTAQGSVSERRSVTAPRSSALGATRRSTVDSESRTSASASTSSARASATETIVSPDGRRIRRKARDTSIASSPSLF